MTDLRAHLIENRLAGEVATSPGESRRNCGRLIDGWPEYTFGLCDWQDADIDEVEAAVVALCGEDAIHGPADGPGWIDPDRTLEAIEQHRERLVAHANASSSVLIATGHPTGLLGHYIRLAEALRAAGCRILTPLDDQWLVETAGGHTGIRYVSGVGCMWNGGDLMHTHLSEYMEAALAHGEHNGGLPELVVADHGMAGAAIEYGIETLGIADVNDPALPLAAARGRSQTPIVIDDNLAPHLFGPVTDALLAGIAGDGGQGAS